MAISFQTQRGAKRQQREEALKTTSALRSYERRDQIRYKNDFTNSTYVFFPLTDLDLPNDSLLMMVMMARIELSSTAHNNNRRERSFSSPLLR